MIDQKRGISSQEISKNSDLNGSHLAKAYSTISYSLPDSLTYEPHLSTQHSQKYGNSKRGLNLEQTSNLSSHTNNKQDKKMIKKKSRGGRGMLGKRKRQQNRIRKSEDQIIELIVEFRINPEWSKEKVAELSQQTGLSESQVYKWNWDQRKKFNEEIDQQDAQVTRDEFGGYCCKKWGKIDDFEDGNICNLLGIDIEKLAQDLVKCDLEKRFKQKSTSTTEQSQIKPIIVQRKQSEDKSKEKISSGLIQTPKPKSKFNQENELTGVVQSSLTDNQKAYNHQTPLQYKQTNDSCHSWINSVNKSPVCVYEPQPFNSFSPWKFEQNAFNHIKNSIQNIRNSPLKSPAKPYGQNNWTKIFSPFTEEKVVNNNANTSMYDNSHLNNQFNSGRTSCFLDFEQND